MMDAMRNIQKFASMDSGLVEKAVFGMLQDRLAQEIQARGPSAQYLKVMATQGWSKEDATTVWRYAVDDALPRASE